MTISVPAFLKRQDQTLMTQDNGRPSTPIPVRPDTPPIAFAPRRAMSAKAAEAAAEWEQLETSYGVACQERDAWRNKANLFEEANEMLHKEIDRLEAKAAFHEKANTVIYTKVSLAADIIASIRDLPSGRHYDEEVLKSLEEKLPETSTQIPTLILEEPKS